LRLAVLSNERLDPWINWTTLGPPLLRPIADYPDAELLTPPPLSSAHRGEWLTLARAVRRHDTMFWIQGGSRPELPVWAASRSRQRVRRSAFVFDAFRPYLRRIGWLAVAQRLDPCFVAFREAYEELTWSFPRGRFEWLPFGVDTEVFRPTGGPRDVFVYWMGRRYDRLHQALLRYCRERGLVYRYTERSGEFTDPAELGQLVARAKYFVVAPPDLQDPGRTGGFSPFVMRYLEGLSAGARLLGVLPCSGEYDALLPRDAILTVAADGSNLAERLDADQRNTGAAAAVARACELVRSTHSWARRAERIHQRLAEPGA
jgi:hypothetical protein